MQQYDAATGEPSQALPNSTSEVISIAYSPDGCQIAIFAKSDDIRIYNTKEGTTNYSHHGHAEIVTSAAFSPCGQWIATGSMDKTVRLWETQSGILVKILRGHDITVAAVIFSLIRGEIASASPDGTIRLWAVGANDRHTVLCSESCRITNIAFSPDGQQIATIDPFNSVRLLSVRTKECHHTLLDVCEAEYVAYSSCGEWIATAGKQWARLWNYTPDPGLQEWRSVTVIDGFVANITGIAWRPHALELATTCLDGSIRVWKVQKDLNEVVVQLLWSFGSSVLNASGAMITDVVGLDTISRRFLKQRGAIDGSTLTDE